MTVLKQTEDDPGNVNTANDAMAQENARRQKAAELEQQRVANARARNTASPVQSQLPARARQVLSSGQQALGTASQGIGDYYSSVAPTSRPQATEDVRRRGSIQQAPSNRYYQTLERFKKPERKDFQEEGKEVDEEAYQQAMDKRTQSMRDFAGQERQDYDAWFKEQMKNNPQILDQRDKRMATPNQKRLRSLGRGLSSVTGLSLPRGLKRKFGTDRVSEMEGSAKNLAMFREQQGEKVAPLTDDGEVNPDYKEILQERPTGEGTTQGTLQDFGVEIDPATKTREETPARTPKGEQVRFMRGDDPVNTGRFGLGNTFGSLKRKKDKPAGADSINPALAREFKPDVNPTGSAPSPAALEAQRQKTARADKERAKTKTTQTTLDV